MTEVSKEAVEALAHAIFTNSEVNAETHSEFLASDIIMSLANRGFTIAPISKTVSDEKLREALARLKFRAVFIDHQCGNNYEVDRIIRPIESALSELVELRASSTWQTIETLPDSLDVADLFATYMGKPYRRYLDCKRDKQFNRWYFECPEMGWQQVGGSGIQITHYCVPKLPTPPATGADHD